MTAEPSEARARTAIRRLALAGVAVVLVVLGMSALLRLRAAGLGCADWPACYGQARTLTEDGGMALARLLHRIAATAATFAVIGIGVFATTQARRFRRELVLSAIMFGLLVALAALGRASARATEVAVPLGNVVGGMVLLALLAGVAFPASNSWPWPPRRLGVLGQLAVVAVLLQIALGVMTSATHSGLACTGLLDCGTAAAPLHWDAGQFDPWRPPAPSAALHLLHRAGALLLGPLLLALAWGLRAAAPLRALVLAAAVLLQAALGLALAGLALPLPLAVLHNSAAGVLVVAVVAARGAAANRPARSRDLI